MDAALTGLANEVAVIGEVGAQRAFELAVAVLCGTILGADRRIHGSAAGMRTCTLVCLGAVLYTHIGDSLIATHGLGDPTRIPGQIITGIGFLGAGAIIHVGRNVSGLTSAAVIWFVGSIGVLIGSGYPLTATVAVVTIVFLMRVLGRVERRLLPRPPSGDGA